MTKRRTFSIDDFPERYQRQIREQLADQATAAPRGRPEATFQDQLVAVARALGWRVFHSRAARQANGEVRTAVAYDGAGFPDLVLAKNGTVLFVELKSPRGRLQPNQVEWRDALEPSGRYRLWRESDWREIEHTLLGDTEERTTE